MSTTERETLRVRLSQPGGRPESRFLVRPRAAPSPGDQAKIPSSKIGEGPGYAVLYFFVAKERDRSPAVCREDRLMIAASLTQDAPAILTGIGAALCLTAAPAFRSRRMILLVQLAAALCFVAHYLFLGITVAAVANMLGMVQTGAALFSARSKAMSWLGYTLIGLMVLSGFHFWQGPISGLSVAAMVLIALARMQSNQLYLRLLLLGGGVFWVMHDFLGAAWIALAADIGALTTGGVALFLLLFRVTIEWRPSFAAPTAPAMQA